MEDYQSNNMATVIKTENKKDMLLSNKDPHLSHLFGGELALGYRLKYCNITKEIKIC